MLGRVFQYVGAEHDRVPPNAGRRTPVGILLLLVVSWATFFAFERDQFATDHPLYYHIPDLTQNAPAVFLNLLVTPLVNTQPDQILLVTGLLVLFGIAVERRFGTWPMIGIFWIASSLAAVLGGALLHVLYPLFPDVHMLSDGGWYRVFNGGSAGAFALMGTYLTVAQRPWLWLGIFLVWEPIFWLVISRDYTSVFHFIAFATGVLSGRWLQAHGR
jgi:hypothetical protein